MTITPSEIKTLLNLNDVKDELIEGAIADAKEYLERKKLLDSPEPAAVKALRYLTAYYLLPKLSYISGSKGIFKKIGHGEATQEHISDADVMRRQQFYWKEAKGIIDELLKKDDDYFVLIDI